MITRVAVAMVALAAWLSVGLGLRAYLGGKAYLARILGSEQLADEAFARALEQPEALLLGMDPWTLLLAFSVAASATLVLLVLTPSDMLMRRLRFTRNPRALVGAALGAAVVAVVLLSIHPLLSMPTVPDGPRTVLNYACEAAGYGWVNAIAYLGAIATGAGLCAAAEPPPRVPQSERTTEPITDVNPSVAGEDEGSPDQSDQNAK